MTDNTLPTHESLEQAARPLREILARLPDNVERRRAEEHVTIAEDLAHQSREKRADRGA